MNRLNWVPLVATLAMGCIIYTDDERGFDEDDDAPPIVDPGFDPTDPGVDDTPDVDDGDVDGDTDKDPETPVVPIAIDFDPAGAFPGEIVIASILTDDVDADLTSVESIDFLGKADIMILASRERNAGELIVALEVPMDSEPGTQDVLVRFEDGVGVFLDEAFEVFDPNAFDTAIAP